MASIESESNAAASGPTEPETALGHPATQVNEPPARGGEFYRGLMAATVQIVWTADPQSMVPDVSAPAWRAFTGQTKDDAHALGWLSVVHPEDQDRVAGAWEQAVESKSLYQCECRIRRSDGVYRWFLVQGVPLLTPEGYIHAWAGTATDFEDAKRAERDLISEAELCAAVGKALTSSAPLRLQLERCAQAIVQHLEAEIACIWTMSDATQTLELQTCGGRHSSLDDVQRRLSVGSGTIGRIAQTREPVVRTTLQHDAQFSDLDWAAREGFSGFVGYPVMVGERVVGVLAVFAGRALTETILHAVAAVADTIALGIARLWAMAEAEAERERLHGLLMQAPAVICYLQGPDHVFILANPRTLQLVGNRPIVGKPARDVLPELTGQGLLELLDAVYTSGTSYSGTEVPLGLNRDGDGTAEITIFNFVLQPTRDASGSVEGVLVHAVDVTEEVRAREHSARLAEQAAAERDLLQQLIDVLPEGVVIADAQVRLTLTNSAAREILGADAEAWVPALDARTAEERYNARHLDGTPYGPEDGLLYRSVVGGELVHGEQLLVKYGGDGRDMPLLANSAPLRNAAGAIIGGVMIFQDISGIKDMEQQKDVFLATVSHDLKNPLTAIVGMAQLLQRRASRMANRDGQRFVDGLQTISSTAYQMATQIDELLDATRLQMARPLHLDLQPADLVAVAERSVHRYQQSTDRHQVRLDTEVPELPCVCDSARISRVFDNLLSNAVKFSPSGGLISLKLARTDEQASIQIIDQGVGVPAGDLPHVFEHFYRASNVVGRIAGTGIGLAGVRQIIEQHGGSISMDSKAGAGTTVTIHIPLAGPVRDTH
ncbi:MAG: domain S-box protein [Chloroflexi bacterium]|nr:domain S-box protein [Chloroflexota bacterium]